MASDITAPSKSREKVSLKPGYSLSNWVTRMNNMPRPTTLRKIPMSEIKLHNKENDCWTILNGRVFDITEYMDYHPGGVKKLMAGAGKDSTVLFNKFHAWVNIGAMIGKCCIGTVGEDDSGLIEEEEEEEDDLDPIVARTEAISMLTSPEDEDTPEADKKEEAEAAAADPAITISNSDAV